VVLVVPPGGKPEPRRIEIGVSDRVNVEVKSGLKEGEVVVIGQEQKAGAKAPSGQQPGQGGRSPLTPGPFPGGGARGGGRF
jgi:hypothetical protein